MRTEDIVEGLNRHIEDKRSKKSITSDGHLVLQRIVKTHPTFKAYKIYENILWFIKDGNKYRVITFNYTARVFEGYEGPIQNHINTELCRLIFNWMSTDSYEKVIKGEYNGISENTNE